jgi:hypothetical protein
MPVRERPTQFSLRSLLVAATIVPPVIGVIVYLIRTFPNEVGFLLGIVLMTAGFCVMVIGMVAGAYLLGYVIYILPIELVFKFVDRYQKRRLKQNRQPPSPSAPG